MLHPDREKPTQDTDPDLDRDPEEDDDEEEDAPIC